MPDFRRAIERRLARLSLAPVRRAEIVEELSQHLQDRYEELRAAGAPEERAAREALAELNPLARQLAEVERPVPQDAPVFGAGGRSMIGAVVHDIRYALRTFVANPGFTIVVLLTLGLGIGATTAIFTVLDGVLLRPLPYPQVERVVALAEQFTVTGASMSVSWPNFQDWRDQNRVFEQLGIYRSTTVNLTGGDQPERLNGAIASSGVFGAMGIHPLVGRVFGAVEDGPGADRVAIVSERLWRSHFNADPSLVGRSIVLNGQAHAVVGIMPATMRFPSRLTDVWLPIGPIVPTFPPRGAHPGLFAIARLKSGITVEQAVADMNDLSKRLAEQYPDSNKNARATVQSYYEQVVQNIRPALLVLIAAVGFVLLIGCANLANLMLSRAESRHREVAIRGALGAARGRLVQQLLVESLLLAVGGGALGSLFAFWAVKAFVASRPSTVPRIDVIAVDGRVLVFAAIVSILTGVLFGLAPALRATSTDLIAGLREGSRGSASAASRRIRSALIVAEVALAMVLLVGAGLTLRSFSRLTAVDPGFNPERVATARINLPDVKYPDRASWTVFHRELYRRMAALPGVESVGLNSAIPLEGGGSEAPVVAEGDPMPSADRPATTTLFQTTSPGYFRTMGIPLVKGRDFTERDTADAARVVIVDDALVAKVFRGTDPIGKRLAFEIRGGGHGSGGGRTLDPIWREVVGVVHHVRHYGLASEPPFVQLYTPFEQLPVYMEQRRPNMALVVRTAIEPDALAASMRREIAAIDRDIPLYAVQTMERYVAQNTEQQRLSMVLLGGFGVLALILAIVGIYGVLSYTVGQRTQEIGIRLALGATRRDVLNLVVGNGMRLAVAGIAIGLAASYALTHTLTALLYEISPHDPVTFVVLAAVLGAVALAASTLPGIRATRVSPVEALRQE
jgi:putative ABC transport system permease protein